MAIHRHLSKTPFNVTTVAAHGGSQAQQMVAQHSIDSIFLDYKLPDIDGISLLKKLRAEGVSIPIIIMTGQGDEHIAVELMKAGATDYLTKDQLSPGCLERVLRSAFRLCQAEQHVLEAQRYLSHTNKLLQRQNRELERQRQQIEQQNLRLLESNRIKGEFLATINHELRTPLNSILGFSKILSYQTRNSLNNHQQKMLERIVSNGENLLHLVSDILDMSELEAHAVTLKPQSFNLPDLLQDILNSFAPLAEQKGLEITQQISLSHPLVFNDPVRLRQILVNLISNAIKFTERGRVNVAIQSPARNCIEISVHDTGMGISADQLETIFHPFHQVDQTTTRQFPGTGLGLTIAHSLVSLMEGFMTVTSEVGQGSTFQVSIPRDMVTPPIEMLGGKTNV
jgi:signal transduction histidine kinase